MDMAQVELSNSIAAPCEFLAAAGGFRRTFRPRFGPGSAPAVDLEAITAALRLRGIKGRLVAHKGTLCWRGTFTGADGVRRERRVNLGLPATAGQLLTAEARVIQLAASIAKEGVLPAPLPWIAEKTFSADSAKDFVTVGQAVETLRVAFWQGKVRTSAAQRTWDRIDSELKRLPPAATITTDLLVSVAGTTAAGSRSRLEACKVFKRLGRAAGLDNLERLDAIRTPYQPGERDLPSDDELRNLLERMGGHQRYGWITWALAAFGCRPAEVFSLRPAGDGTAQVLTIKRKGALPTWRTAMALPLMAAPGDRRVPWDISAPAGYDSLEAKRVTQAWGHWLKSNAPGLQLYALRHAWAVRSIRQGVPTGLAAKCMGHEVAIHCRSYHRWLDAADVAAFIALRG